MKYTIIILLAFVSTTIVAQNEFTVKAQEFMSMVKVLNAHYKGRNMAEWKRLVNEYDYATICDSVNNYYGQHDSLPEVEISYNKEFAARRLAELHNCVFSPVPDVLGILDKMQIDDGYTVVLARPDSNYGGDVSRWMALPDSTKDINQYVAKKISSMNSWLGDVWDKLKTEPSAIGAWQAFLMYRSMHFMPKWWHAGYMGREYIFDSSSIDSLNVEVKGYADEYADQEWRWGLEPEQYAKYKTITIDLPKIEFNIDTQEAAITVYYWNDWSGLVKETTYIEISPDGRFTVDKKEPEEEVLVQYDCGIQF